MEPPGNERERESTHKEQLKYSHQCSEGSKGDVIRTGANSTLSPSLEEDEDTNLWVHSERGVQVDVSLPLVTFSFV